MTATSRLTRYVAPVVSAATTTAVLSGALWIQHARGGWPFPASEHVAAAAPAPAGHDTAAMDPSARP
jgi:hypothetical protein